MVRSYFGKIKDIKLAAQDSFLILSRTKRPRHIDRTGVALSRLSRQHKSRSFPRQEVLRTVLKMYEKSGDTKTLGPLIKPYVEDSLPALAHAGYIEIDEINQTLRIKKRAAKMMNDIYREIQDIDFKTTLEKYFAHCDAYRQRIGNGSDKTKKELINEFRALFEANALLKAQLMEVQSQHNLREDVNVFPQSSDDDIDMDETPIQAGPSTPIPNTRINVTQFPQKTSANPEAAYHTPISPQRPRGSFRISASPPPSPSPLSRQPTLQYQNDTEMNVDKDNIIGKPSQTLFDEPPAGSWGFGRYLRNLANILSSSVGSHKYPGADHQALGQELQDKVMIETEVHHELATSLENCRKSLETANATIVTREEQLKVVQEKYQAALRTNEVLQAEVTIIRNKLFHSELGRKALLARVAKLEKKLHKTDIYHDEEIQLWVTRVDELKQQISLDEIKARALAEDWKRREAELQEVEKRQLKFQEYQESFDQMFEIMQRKPHLWPSQNSPK